MMNSVSERTNTQVVRRNSSLGSWIVWIVLALSSSGCLAQALSDEIFNSSLEGGIALKGKAGYPLPLAGATIELHLGTYVATTLTAANGSYSLLVEQNHIDAPAIAEIFAFGHGADSAQVWAGNLGPTDRLLTLVVAGAVSFPDEPFLNLNPRSTSIAAALRAYNGFAPVADKTTFYKAARSYQVQTQDIAYGLALIARGDQALPPGATNTFAAVATLANLQKVFADEQALAANCDSTPTAPYCQVRSTLPLDPTIVPTHPWVDGRIYAGITGFDFPLENPIGFRPNGSSIDLIGIGGTLVTGNVTFEADGSKTLTRSGGAAFSTSVTFPVINGSQVEQDEAVYTIHVRTSLGPGGQLEGQGSPVRTYTYPGHPEIVSYTAADPWEMPGYLGADPLPAELLALIPDVANGGFVLASPFVTADSAGPYGYDVYNFSATTGVTERAAKSFTFSGGGTAVLSLNFAADSTTGQVSFVNEEMPGIWRVRMHAVGATTDQIFDGLMMATTGSAGGFTPANVQGTYEADLNGYACGGPYGALESFCLSPLAWTFANGGIVLRQDFPSGWGEWQLPGGADAGRLLLARPSFVATPVNQRRGWELVRATGPNDVWILENVTVSPSAGVDAPPIVFYPATRLTHITVLQ
jgi:hypothetical protein